MLYRPNFCSTIEPLRKSGYIRKKIGATFRNFCNIIKNVSNKLLYMKINFPYIDISFQWLTVKIKLKSKDSHTFLCLILEGFNKKVGQVILVLLGYSLIISKLWKRTFFPKTAK